MRTAIALLSDDETTPIEPLRLRRSWRWPWVTRKALEFAQMQRDDALYRCATLERDCTEALRERADQRKTIAQLITERAYMEDQVNGAKESLQHLRVHCNELEAKQRDLDEPPISSKDLEALLKRHSFVNTQNTELLRVNEKLESELKRLSERLNTDATQARG